MRRLLLVICLFLLIGIGLALVFHDRPGMLLIAFNGWRVQTTLAFACVALLVALWLLYLVVRVVTAGALLPRRARRQLAARRARVKQAALFDGLTYFAEQRWPAAEKQLNRLIRSGEHAGLMRLMAACTAQAQGHEQDRDGYLAHARAGGDISELASGLTTAELQRAAGQRDALASTVARLYKIEPNHPRVLKLYAETLEHRGDYAALSGVLPRLAKYGQDSDDRSRYLARLTWQSKLDEATTVRETLISTWSRAPRDLQHDRAMIVHYIGCLRRVRAEDEARQVVKNYLDRHWDPELVKLYGQLPGGDPSAGLANVEKWIDKHGRRPELLLVAGRLCLRAQLWDRARDYLESGDDGPARADVLLELGSLYEQIGESDNARAAYRRGLALQVDS